MLLKTPSYATAPINTRPIARGKPAQETKGTWHLDGDVAKDCIDQHAHRTAGVSEGPSIGPIASGPGAAPVTDRPVDRPVCPGQTRNPRTTSLIRALGSGGGNRWPVTMRIELEAYGHVVPNASSNSITSSTLTVLVTGTARSASQPPARPTRQRHRHR